MKKSNLYFLIGFLMVSLQVTPAPAAEPITVTQAGGAVAPPCVTYMTLGSPTDTFALRVSLCSTRNMVQEPYSYIIVEELLWPPPEPKRTVEETPDGFRITLEDIEEAWLICSSKIDGKVLNQARRNLPLLPASTDDSKNVIRGEYNDHWLRPFQFTEWISPIEFMIEDSRGRFVIRRKGPGEFELAEVVRIK